MIIFFQINLHWSGMAMNLSRQAAKERGANVLWPSEQPRGPPDSDRWVALTSCADLTSLASGRGMGFS